ncbi:hypothetical protein FB45DRAFT_917519 [Roridomyces roridus]|uniref:Uncharacterized protein n=1 Tax=Roridomyces roridus TaxID=1738132 RepID=A0AAD7BUX7_9AGAR|nr:hypothetical protein FB45DRAFT_917519 [Roridomyces roridus]
MAGPSNHQRRESLDTNASGISLGISAMSFSGFSHRFPVPPASIPNTPVSAVFGPISPLIPRPSNLSATESTAAHSREESLRNIGPYDWHEGASSIDVDATEHALLSTAFITSLLRENPEHGMPGPSQRNSVASSGFSEMTYPPARMPSSVMRVPPSQRPQGARPPPSSFQPIPESPAPVSDDDDTLYSNSDPIIRRASVSRPLGGARAVGVASGTLRTLKAVSDAPSYGIKEELDLEYTPHDSLPYSPALPSTAGTQRRFLPQTSPEVRESMHSGKSRVPSFISTSSRSLRRMLPWRKKPLPPVPKIAHIPVAEEAAFKQKEEATSLSQLLIRSDALRTALDTGQNPHYSFNSGVPVGLVSRFDDEQSNVHPLAPFTFAPNGAPAPEWAMGPSSPQIKANNNSANARAKKRRIWFIMGVFLLVALAAVGAAIGVTVHKRGSKTSASSCSGNLAGVACNLDATCVCTSPLANRCDGLAQNLATLTPTMNSLFGTNFTTNDVYLWIWTVQGTSTAKNCASQAVLVDVGAADSLAPFPNRTQWAEAALLWDLQSLNNSGLQEFVANAPWSSLSVDGPVNATSFSTVASGYQFDFAAQTISVPSVSFISDGQPTSDQAAQVASTVPLDRMYSFASAAATQYQAQLQTFWVTNLQRSAKQLPIFMNFLRSAPIMIPFDVETSSVRSLLTSSTDFPVPIGCYPNLTASQIQQISALEGVFGLSPLTAAPSQFSTSCFPTRPIYGVLDVLRLRLPFADSRTNVARQAVALKADVGPRAVVYGGEVLSAYPGTPNISSAGISLDPNAYGTLGHMDHVVLQWLSSMPTLVASAVADFVVSNSTVPPTSSSVLFSTTIPALEVAVFGTLSKADLDFVASGFADSAGGLVFGNTDFGTPLRNWAIPAAGSIHWTQLSNASEVVYDTSFTDPTFNTTWAAAAAPTASVSDIVNSFIGTGKFSP